MRTIGAGVITSGPGGRQGESVSRLSEATKKQMYDHAVEVVEEENENRAAESKGYNRDPGRICRLYDISDEMFKATRVKSLLDELTEVYAQLTAYKEAQADTQRLVRDLDVLLNGKEAAQQASLCDIVSQVQAMMRQGHQHPTGRLFGSIAEGLASTRDGETFSVKAWRPSGKGKA